MASKELALSSLFLLWNQITPTPLNDNLVTVVVALERQKCVAAAEAMTINRERLRLRRPHYISRSLAVPLPVFHVSGNGLEAMILTSRRPSCIPTPFPLPHRGEGGSQSGVRGENRGGEKAERPSAARKAGDT